MTIIIFITFHKLVIHIWYIDPPHPSLLSFLPGMGTTSTELSWFEFYLTGDSFRMSRQGQLLAPHHLSTGVPQGPELGCCSFSYTQPC